MNPISTRYWRDVGIFLLGAGGFIHEVLSSGTERPTILLGCLALLGVPVFLHKDEAVEEEIQAAQTQDALELKESSHAPPQLNQGNRGSDGE